MPIERCEGPSAYYVPWDGHLWKWKGVLDTVGSGRLLQPDEGGLPGGSGHRRWGRDHRSDGPEDQGLLWQ